MDLSLNQASCERKMTHYWKIAPGRGGENWPEQRDEGVIAVGWNEMGDLRKIKNESDLLKLAKQKKREHNYTQTPKHICDQLWTFYKTVKPHDVVMACSGHLIYGIGKITGDYKFDSDLTAYHSRPVRWQHKFWEPIDAYTFKHTDNKLGKHIKNIFGAPRNKITIKNLESDRVKEITGQAVFGKISHRINKTRYPIAFLPHGWKGMTNAPQSEQELIVLFSKMRNPDIKIDYVSTRFPDALVRIREHGNWVTRGVEFELNASGFCTHFKSKMSKQRMEGNKDQRCDLICWKNDMPDIAKKTLKKITESRKKNGVMFPIRIRELRKELIREQSR